MGDVIYPQSKTIMVSELLDGMMIDEEVYSLQGSILIPKGQIIEDAERVRDMLVQHDAVMIKVRLPKKFELPEDLRIKNQTSEETTQERQLRQFAESFDKKCDRLKSEFEKILLNKNASQEAVEERMEEALTAFDANINVIQLMQKVRGTDDATYMHSHNVALTSHLMGRWLKMPEDEIKELTMSALLIDIGKIKVSETVINKKEQLTAEEYEEVKRHVVHSYEAVKGFTFLSKAALDGILYHHERMDGSGYPQGLKGKAIPLFARIIAVADVYNAMTSKRPYREKLTPFQTIQVLETEYNEKLDPEILYLFLNRIATLFIGQQVKLEDGKTGEIIFIPKNHIYRPMIRLIDTEAVIDLNQPDQKHLQIVEFV